MRQAITLLITILMSSSLLVSSAFADKKAAGVDGIAISVGQLSPVEFGVLDESHVQTGARIGYRFGRLQPYLILDYAQGNLEAKDTYLDYDFDTDMDVEVTSEDAIKASLLTVGLGLKYLLVEPKSGAVQTYLSGSVFTFIPTLEIDEKVIDEISDNSTAFGVLAGFGAQYSFHKRFSLGLELGLSYSNIKADFGDDDLLDVALTHSYQMFFLEFIL